MVDCARIPFNGVRLVVKTSKPFDAVCAAIESALGRIDVAALSQSSTRDQIMSAANAGVGSSGFAIFQVIEHGRLLAALGLGTAKARLYVIGNALVAAEMTKVDLLAGLHAPLRLMVYEAGGETLLTYVQPSSVLTAAGIADTARKLDQGLAHLTNVAGS